MKLIELDGVDNGIDVPDFAIGIGVEDMAIVQALVVPKANAGLMIEVMEAEFLI